MSQTFKRSGRVLIFALTMSGLNPEQAERSMIRVFQNYRNRWPGRRYFWWAEFQKRGALHYHGILVDPPFEHLRDARHYFDQHWPHAGIQTYVEWKTGHWFHEAAGAYMLKDVRKVAGKWYEQEYDRMPLHWRTFSSSQLDYEIGDHIAHENELLAGWNPQTRQVEVVETRLHIPAEGGCRLVRARVHRQYLAQAAIGPPQNLGPKVLSPPADSQMRVGSGGSKRATGSGAPGGRRDAACSRDCPEAATGAREPASWSGR